MVYIATSLVMTWNQDRTNRAEDRVVLIDLAHPMTNDMDGFEQAKQSMLLGTANLKRISLGQGIDAKPEEEAGAVPEEQQDQIPQGAQNQSDAGEEVS